MTTMGWLQAGLSVLQVLALLLLLLVLRKANDAQRTLFKVVEENRRMLLGGAQGPAREETMTERVRRLAEHGGAPGTIADKLRREGVREVGPGDGSPDGRVFKPR